jgi:hypothetical protein
MASAMRCGNVGGNEVVSGRKGEGLEMTQHHQGCTSQTSHGWQLLVQRHECKASSCCFTAGLCSTPPMSGRQAQVQPHEGSAIVHEAGALLPEVVPVDGLPAFQQCLIYLCRTPTMFCARLEELLESTCLQIRRGIRGAKSNGAVDLQAEHKPLYW